MNNRLEKIAACIEDGLGFIDVGTDHGRLPSVMAHLGYSGNIYASDIGEAPLASARRTAAHFGVADRISFLLCDGLELCPPEKVDTIVIAGMGGDNICGILDRAEWCMDRQYKLILQPMKKAEVLRYWLVNNGFSIESEMLVSDSGMLYQLFSARFGAVQMLSDAELYAGCYRLIKDDPLFPDMLRIQTGRFQKALSGLLKTDSPELQAKISFASGILNELKEMKS